LRTNLINNDNEDLVFYAHASDKNNIPFDTLSATTANMKSVSVNANSEKNQWFLFDQVSVKGSVVSVSTDSTPTYYVYVFVTDSDGEHFVESYFVDR